MIPQAVKEVIERNYEIEERVDSLIILYEPHRGEEHKTGFFYVGHIVNRKPASLPEQAEVINIRGKYATATGTIKQMAKNYSYIGNWIKEQQLKQVWPEALFIEIYDGPIGAEITGNEEVKVCLPIN
ncbi:hypothetical protein [Cohnella laeviribosi]|uniref:hypothetical protein n=1 Tax=Cohnella laeviribosi TaxID=380174 RepID=UPI00035E231F|nr:hypothetical protein [Cohnella laeviribosi]